VTPRESGVTLQSWLWSPPAKHSTRQIEELLERIAKLCDLGSTDTLPMYPMTCCGAMRDA
jgi:hypothetical protein